MPPRFAYWTILIDNTPTAFRARDREELLPTFAQLKRKSDDVVIKWFAQGRLWDSPEAQRSVGRKPAFTGEKRGNDWRPGGTHKDPRDRFKKKNRPERAWSEGDAALAVPVQKPLGARVPGATSPRVHRVATGHRATSPRAARLEAIDRGATNLPGRRAAIAHGAGSRPAPLRATIGRGRPSRRDREANESPGATNPRAVHRAAIGRGAINLQGHRAAIGRGAASRRPGTSVRGAGSRVAIDRGATSPQVRRAAIGRGAASRLAATSGRGAGSRLATNHAARADSALRVASESRGRRNRFARAVPRRRTRATQSRASAAMTSRRITTEDARVSR